MLKTNLDIDDFMYRTLRKGLDNARLSNVPVYIQNRPHNVSKECIVINSYGLNAVDGYQKAMGNVNIHIPDFNTKINGQGQFVIDRERFRTLVEVVVNTLEAVTGRIRPIIEKMGTYDELDIHEHWMNIRIVFIVH